MLLLIFLYPLTLTSCHWNHKMCTYIWSLYFHSQVQQLKFPLKLISLWQRPSYNILTSFDCTPTAQQCHDPALNTSFPQTPTPSGQYAILLLNDDHVFDVHLVTCYCWMCHIVLMVMVLCRDESIYFIKTYLNFIKNNFYFMSNALNANQFINLALVFEHKTINIETYKLTTKYNMRWSENHSNQCTDSELIDLFFINFKTWFNLNISYCCLCIKCVHLCMMVHLAAKYNNKKIYKSLNSTYSYCVNQMRRALLNNIQITIEATF